MAIRLVLALVLMAFALASLPACQRAVPSPAPASGPPQRIVSMSPSVTEILFALGLGDHVVGVTRYCLYPPEAQTRAKIGGHLDPNYEAVVETALQTGYIEQSHVPMLAAWRKDPANWMK